VEQRVAGATGPGCPRARLPASAARRIPAAMNCVSSTAPLHHTITHDIFEAYVPKSSAERGIGLLRIEDEMDNRGGRLNVVERLSITRSAYPLPSVTEVIIELAYRPRRTHHRLTAKARPTHHRRPKRILFLESILESARTGTDRSFLSPLGSDKIKPEDSTSAWRRAETYR